MQQFCFKSLCTVTFVDASDVFLKWMLCFQTIPSLTHKPLLVDMAVQESSMLKVVYGSSLGFHCVDLDTFNVTDIYMPQSVSVHLSSCYCIVFLLVISLVQYLIGDSTRLEICVCLFCLWFICSLTSNYSELLLPPAWLNINKSLR